MPTSKKEVAVTKVQAKNVTKKLEKKPAKKAVAKPVKKATAKATKKTSPAKAPAKAKASKSPAKKPLRYSDDVTSFWLTDGQILNSLLSLRDALEDMSDEVYSYHVGGGRNDFSSWVEAVLCDEACAKELAKAKTPRSAKTAVVKHLKLYIV